MKYLIFILLLGSCVGKPKYSVEEQKKAYDSVVADMKRKGWLDKDTTLLPEVGSVHPTVILDSGVQSDATPKGYTVKDYMKAWDSVAAAGKMNWHSSGGVSLDSAHYQKRCKKSYKRRKTIGTTDVRELKLTLYWDSVPRHQYGYMLDSKEKITLWDRNGNGYSFDSVGNLMQNGKPMCHCDTVSRSPQDSVIHFGVQY